MKLTSVLRTMCRCFVLFSFSLLIVSSSPDVLAGVWNYGDYNGPDVGYLEVTESNTTASQLFEGPTLVGNSLTFSPLNFAVGGAGLINEFADSTITTNVDAAAGQVINDIQVTESGDFTLSGIPSLYGQVTVGAAFFVEILEIDNDPGHSALPLPSLSDNMTFTTGSGPNGGVYSRPTDDGTAIVWTGSVLLDLDQFLVDNSVTGNVTKAKLRWDNSLSAAAVAGSTAFIKKKQTNAVTVTATVSEVVPEPTTLVGLSLMGLLVLARRRRTS